MDDDPIALESRSPISAVALTPIGRLVTSFTNPSDTPIQSQRDERSPGRVVVDEQYRRGLEGMHEFDYVFLVTFLDHPGTELPDDDSWQVVPFLLADSQRKVGTFATRHPCRPNPIGLSLVRVTAMHVEGFEFEGVDMIDGTPLLDIKPWVPAFDTPRDPPGEVRTGWYTEAVLSRDGASPTELSGSERTSS